MNDILEGFEESLDDLKDFPDKGKITALTKIVRCTFSLLNIRALSNATLFFYQNRTRDDETNNSPHIRLDKCCA